MRKILCDRCGKEINVLGHPYSLRLDDQDCDLYDQDYDLCSECCRELRRWILDYGKERKYEADGSM